MRLTLPSGGPTLDLYNVHMDAGTDSGDNAARRKNVQQVADYIDANSAGVPVLVFGDTNTRYSRAEDNIRVFGTQSGLSDAWVTLVKGGTPPAAGSVADACGNPAASNNCEVVDKVL